MNIFRRHTGDFVLLYFLEEAFAPGYIHESFHFRIHRFQLEKRKKIPKTTMMDAQEYGM